MSYFLMYSLENGVRLKHFLTSDHLKECLESDFTDYAVKFYDYAPLCLDELAYNEAIIIKGDICVPVPVTIVKSFEIN